MKVVSMSWRPTLAVYVLTVITQVYEWTTILNIVQFCKGKSIGEIIHKISYEGSEGFARLENLLKGLYLFLCALLIVPDVIIIIKTLHKNDNSLKIQHEINS
jgi:hypothetical protein